MRVAVAFDHRGTKLRDRLLEVLAELRHEAVALVRAFLGARFDGGERYVRRLRKLEAMERAMANG